MAKKKKSAKTSPRKNKNGESLRILISRVRVQKRITEIEREIRKDFPDEPLHLVGVLKGAVFFLTDLGKQIPGDVSFDFRLLLRRQPAERSTECVGIQASRSADRCQALEAGQAGRLSRP